MSVARAAAVLTPRHTSPVLARQRASRAPQRTPGLLEPHINSVSISEPQTAWVNFKLDTQTADTLNYRRSRALDSGLSIHNQAVLSLC